MNTQITRRKVTPEMLIRRGKHGFAIPSQPVMGSVSPAEPPFRCLQRSGQLTKEGVSEDVLSDEEINIGLARELL
ncbi:hypothetical protein Q31a_25310 [Aureliella helgolandensis]|uniref:Uncharacterized protein n=1 Tax=Aureliella helgolandensis TaxID=2527968 RepID=A0A518G6K5_9BACT|nr:hypothetical protein Q31a_25310 [Aureliella helgolandensis]